MAPASHTLLPTLKPKPCTPCRTPVYYAGVSVHLFHCFAENTTSFTAFALNQPPCSPSPPAPHSLHYPALLSFVPQVIRDPVPKKLGLVLAEDTPSEKCNYTADEDGHLLGADLQ